MSDRLELHKLPPRFRAMWTVKYDRSGTRHEGEIRCRPETAIKDIPSNAKSAVVLKDDRYHEDNAGKFFLYQIVK